MAKLKQLDEEKKIVEEFLKSLGVEEYRSGTFSDDEYNLSGYYYGCCYLDKCFTFYIDPNNGIYFNSAFEFSNDDKEFLSRLSKMFGTNLNELKFSSISFNMFKLEPLPEEIINLTSNNDKIHLSTKNNRIYVSVRNKLSLLYDKETKKFIILRIKNWETYNKIRSMIDEDIREALDKLSVSKPEFLLETEDGKLLGLEGEMKKNVLKLLDKLLSIVRKINKIDVINNKVVLNNIVLELEDWDSNIPIDILEKMIEAGIPVGIEIHKDFWLIKVHNSQLPKVANVLNIENLNIIDPKKISPYFNATENYYVFSTPIDYDVYYDIVSSENVKKYLQSLGVNVNITQQNNNRFEINDNDYKYIIIKGEKDEIHVNVVKDDKSLTSLKTYLWYFGTKDFSELKNLNKETIINIINKQLKERYFYPVPFDYVKQNVMTLVDNTIKAIDETINDVKNRIPNFTKSIKSIVAIDCIFSENCGVKLELDKIGRLSSYYSLIATDAGHLPVPIFLELSGIEGGYNFNYDEFDISDAKNLIYLIRGYKENIYEDSREYYLPDDNVRGAESELFQKAVVLYNKLILPNKSKAYYIEDEEEEECPEYALPDGFGYCRDFDYQPLMEKSEDELINDIIESLTKMRNKMTKVKEKILKSEFPLLLRKENS